MSIRFQLTALSFAIALVVVGSCAMRCSDPSPAPETARGIHSDRRAVETEAWLTFVSSEPRFTVEFPAPPHSASDVVDTPIGKQPVARYKAALEGGVFDAGYLKRSRNALALLVGEEKILESACQGTARHMGGRIMHSSPMNVDGCSGRELVIELPGTAGTRCARARLIITTDAIFHAIVQLPDDSEQSTARANRFLNSVHVGAAAVARR